MEEDGGDDSEMIDAMEGWDSEDGESKNPWVGVQADTAVRGGAFRVYCLLNFTIKNQSHT